MAINVKIDPDIQHLIKGFEKGAKQFNSKSASKTKLKFAIDEKSFSRPLGKITGQVNMFESAMEAANARVIAFGASTAVLATVVKSLKDLVNVSIEVEAAFADINRILNLSGGNLDKFSNKLFDTAQKTASTFQAASSAALEFSRQGLKTEEVLKRTSDALTLVRLTGMNAKKSVDLLTATVNAFTDLDTTSAVDKFVAVETKFAVAARDLVEGLSRVGSAAVDAKVDFNELNALITAVQQTTGRGGAVIGNALKTIFTRLQRESTLEALERFNVTVRDVQGNILPATQVLDNFAGKYDKLADSTQAYLREQVAGVFQANILSAILKDLNKEQSTFSRALDVSVNATENAAQANEKLNQTMSALLQNTATEFAKLQKNLGDAAFLDLGKGIVGAMQTALKSLNSALDKDSTGAGAFFAQGFISGLSNVLQGPVLIGALQIILKVAKQSFTFLAQAIPTLLNITTQAQKRAQTEEFINNLLRSDVDLAKQIVSAEGNQSRQLELVLAKSRAITEQYQAQYRLSTSLGGAIVSGGSFITAAGVKGSTASKIKNKAGGYTPSINAEQSAINRGVGGAGGGAYPVVIPNFAFGGGNVGPVVANSSEVIVPNYGGSGGSAIFNQQMISQYGIPNGAVPIASKGLVSKNKKVGRQFEKDVGNAIGVNPSYNSPIDFSSVIRKPASKGFGPHLYRKNAIADAHSGLGHTASQIVSKLLNELHEKPESNIKLGWDDAKNTFVLDSGFIEIIGAGKDRRGVTRKSNFSSLGSRAKKRYSDLEGQDFFTKYNQDYVSLSSGYIPNFAAGRGTLSSTADPLNLKAAQAENPFINSLDTGKLGFDRHEKLNIRLTNKKGGDKKGGGNINREFGNNAEKKAAPIVKKMGYFPAHKAGMFNSEHSAVDFIKTSNGLPKGGALTGVMELKAGGIKPETISKPLRAITENLHLPIVQNMFKKEGPENLKYDSILATRKIGPDPYKMTGMMRKGMGKGANMARGYVPNFAKGRARKDLKKHNKSKQSAINTSDMNAAIDYAANAINSLGMSAESAAAATKKQTGKIVTAEMIQDRINSNLSKSATASGRFASGLKSLKAKVGKAMDKPGVAMGLMFGAPMLAGLAEQTITGGKSRLDQTSGQRLGGSAVSNITSFATSGAMIGGLPGAVAGGLIGLGKAASDASLSLGELKQMSEEYKKTTQQITSAGEQYIKAQEDIQKATQALDANKLQDAQKRAAESLKTLRSSGEGLDNVFASSTGDIKKMTESLVEFERKRQQGAAITDLGTVTETSRGGIKSVGLAKNFANSLTQDPEQARKIGSLISEIATKSETKTADIATDPLLNAPIVGKALTNTAEIGLKFFGSKTIRESIGDQVSDVLTSEGLIDEDMGKLLAAQIENIPIDQLNDYLQNLVIAFKSLRTDPNDITDEMKQLGFNFTNLKTDIATSVQAVKNQISKRNMSAEFRSAMENLQNAVLNGINAPITKFQTMKSQLSKAQEDKFASERDKFYTDNVLTFTNTLGDISKGQNTQELIKKVEADMRAGRDVSNLRSQLYETMVEDAAGPVLITEKQMLAIKTQEDAYKLLIQTQSNEEKILIEKLRIEKIKAENTKKELEAQREISILRAERRIADAEMSKQQADVNLALSRRQFGLDMSVGLTGSQRIRESQSIAGARFKANVGNLNAKEQRDLDRSFADEERAIADARRKTLGQVDPGDVNYSIAFNDFVKRQKEIQVNATADRKQIELKVSADRDKFNEEYRQINEKFLRDLQKRGPSGFGVGLDEGMGMVGDDLETFQYQLGRDIPMQFRDGMVSAMEATLDKTKDLKGALTDMAMDFMRIMRRQALENIVGSVMTIGGKQQGGFIKAQNGMYISGNRTGDRNPAMLEDGEYVLNRNAVRSLGGPSAIDRLNFGIAPRFKGGGAFLNMGVDSGRMSSKYFAGDDPLLGEMRDAAIAREQRRQEKKAKKTALRNMIIQTAVSAAISSGASAMKGSGKFANGAPKADKFGMPLTPGGYADSQVGSSASMTLGSQSGGYISSGPRNVDSVPAFMAGGEFVMNNKAVKKYGLGFMSRINGGYIPGYQSGGSVAESAEKLGSSNSSNTNNINISINMGSGSNESEGGSEGNDQSGTSDEKTKAKDLSERVRTVVLQVINEEQRTGGSLSKTKVAR